MTIQSAENIIGGRVTKNLMDTENHRALLNKLALFAGRAKSLNAFDERLFFLRNRLRIKDAEGLPGFFEYELGPYLENYRNLLRRASILDRFPSITKDNAHHLSRFTRRELEVMNFLLEGRKPAAISTLLGVKRETVERHIARAYEKLRVHSKKAAIRRLGEIIGEDS